MTSWFGISPETIPVSYSHMWQCWERSDPIGRVSLSDTETLGTASHLSRYLPALHQDRASLGFTPKLGSGGRTRTDTMNGL